MVRWRELLRPTRRMDEDEWERVRTMSRARYAGRLTGWATRAMATVAVLTVLIRLVTEPAFRSRVHEWRFVAAGVIVVGQGAVGIYLIGAFVMWPSLRRTGREREPIVRQGRRS